MNDRRKSGVSEEELVRRLGELPRRIEPRNDPWPAIRSRITSGGVRRSRFLPGWSIAAAAVMFAFVTGLFLGRNWESAPLDGAVNAAAAGLPSSLGVTLSAAEREYQAAFSEFIAVGRTRDQINAATVEKIEHGWQEMLDTELALNAALEQDPGNPWLNARRLELRERQLAFLKQLAGLEQAGRRTSI